MADTVSVMVATALVVVDAAYEEGTVEHGQEPRCTGG